MSEINSRIADTNTGFIRIRGSAFMDNGRIAYRYILYGNGEFSALDFSTDSAAVLAQITASGNNLILPNGTLVRIANPPGASVVAATIREQAPQIQQYLTAVLEDELAQKEAAATPAPVPTPTPTPAPTPPPATNPADTNITNTTNTTSTASATVITTPESVTVITEESTTTTSSGSTTITVPPTTSAPNTTATTATTTPPRTSPETTTNPSNAALPLGDDIDDIYDPNLTPEQIASLSPGDRQARENFFIEEAGGDPNTDGLGEVEEDGTIVVTAPGEDDEIVVNGRVDWRARLSLAPDSTYFYNNPAAGILAPLISTNGVIFPYTPAININYVASYEPASIVHNNYKVFQYSNSFIDSVTITCDFTAQDDGEANYMLAVIHFFRSLTKMFFGQDQQPKAGTPPPLCYLRGMGAYQFANHPLAVSSFAYNLPNDVDYISTAGPITTQAPTATNNLSSSLRLPPNVVPGGVAAPPMFESKPIADRLTWVPTKMQMVITCIPMMSRNEVSNVFSLEEYSNGILVSEGFW
jgi:Predicted solute binding protein